VKRERDVIHLVAIVSVIFEAAESQQLLGAHRHHAVMLQNAIDDEKRLFDDREP
jgi:hypothetical protein